MAVRVLRFVVVVSLLNCAVVAPTTVAAPLAPGAGQRVVQQAAFVASELQESLTDDDSPETASLRSFIDTTGAIRVYHRDGKILFAISTTRNLSAAEKWDGERAAAVMARKILAKEFAQLDTDTGFRDLDARAVQVVFIEPEAFQPTLGGSLRHRSVLGGTGGRCGGRFFGDGSTPIPFAPAGFWAGGSATSAPCVGCR